MPTTPFVLAQRVYWEDTDATGVVYHANYLKFFERARTEWLRALGFEQHRLRLSSNLQFVVAEATLRFVAPARLDDELLVDCRLREAGRATLVLAQEARRGDALLAAADVRLGCLDAGTFRPARIPNALLESLAAA